MKESVVLAQYKSVKEYNPRIGDFVVWTGWWSTWVGVISTFEPRTNQLGIIFSNIPLLLFTMGDSEQIKETKSISLEKIVNAPQGTWAIQQLDIASRTQVWYI